MNMRWILWVVTRDGCDGCDKYNGDVKMMNKVRLDVTYLLVLPLLVLVVVLELLFLVILGLVLGRR
jgi:hypothetical protein